MSLLPQPTTVFIVGPDDSLREAFARLMNLDRGVKIIGTSPVTGDPKAAAADVVVDESLLGEFKNLSIGNFMQMVKSLPRFEAAQTQRHLVPVPTASSEMRTLLSDRELQVVRLLAEGMSNKEISLRLELSDKTVKNHISHILAKLHLTARTQIAVHALRAGIA